jgi:hypothetical protein
MKSVNLFKKVESDVLFYKKGKRRHICYKTGKRDDRCAILIKKEIVKLRYHSIKETLVDTLI